MICEKCKEKMIWKIDGSTQGWSCPECGWNVITSYISEINLDETEYSIYIEKPLKIETEKIMIISKIANVNYIVAKQMLEEEYCILKARATKVKDTINKLEELDIKYHVNPSFKY